MITHYRGLENAEQGYIQFLTVYCNYFLKDKLKILVEFQYQTPQN